MIDDTIKKDVELQNEEPEVDNQVTDLVPAKDVKEPDVIDVDLGFVEKKRFRIAGDYNRMLELPVSDLNVYARLNASYPKLQKLLDEARKKVDSISEGDSPDLLGTIADALTYIDTEMRNLIDYIFDAEVSKVVAPSGNMFDPIGGQYRFERVLDIVTGLYTNNLNEEFNKMKNRVNKKTSKYTKGKK